MALFLMMMGVKRILLCGWLLGILCGAETLPDDKRIAENAAAKAGVGEENQRNYVRVEEGKDAIFLQTSVVKMEKDGVILDLLGAIHIADAAYYKELNERFTKYDRLLFEMVGGEELAKINDGGAHAVEDKGGRIEKEKKEKAELAGLRNLYVKAAKVLDLQLQNEGIDYLAKNFVHADLTLKEFEKKQEERKESLIGFALKSSFASMFKPRANEPNSLVLMMAMLRGDAAAMKREMIHTLGEADDQIEGLSGKSVIVDDRNEKCLQVLEKELAAGHKKIGIFYGSAHFPSMEVELENKGWRRTGEEWLSAWSVPKLKKAATPKELKPKQEPK